MKYPSLLITLLFLFLPAAFALSSEQRAFLQDSIALAKTPGELRQVLQLLEQNNADLREEPAIFQALSEKAAAFSIPFADYPAIQLPALQQAQQLQASFGTSGSGIRWPLVSGVVLILLVIVGIELYRTLHTPRVADTADASYATFPSDDTSSIPPALRSFLEDGLSKGYAPAELRTLLLKSGWDQEMVDAALQQIQQ
ncbi:hypothetical protein HY491_03415 [Candidatus Woesearchaeota archaeon]|nr:hypothetical protein [Candidatus Woesearchaeota archaeon]